jgi:RNA polymerase sigma-70 factor (TIGR02960 family)
MTEALMLRAVDGDETAFRDLTDPYRRELEFHCYRMLGSLQDAEDMLQETMLAAWRGLPRFEGRASLRGWLYTIATNRCLNAMRASSRRTPPRPEPPFEPPRPTRVGVEPTWLDPYPDALLGDVADIAPGPDARVEGRESVELAFIVALQCLPPRQRAVLLLRDVLGFRSTEVAEMLDTSDEAVKSALKRARDTLDSRATAGATPPPAPDSAAERELVDRFVAAFLADDIDAIVALLTDDAWLAMPPSPLEYQGPAAIGALLREVAAWRSGQEAKMVATRANTQPAFACYRAGDHADMAHATGLIVLSLSGERISRITWFLNPGTLGRFGLPRTI